VRSSFGARTQWTRCSPGTSPDGCSSQGCASNQGSFYDRFDAVVLLSVPREVIFQRIATRSTNPFGKGAHEQQRILADLEAVEPLLRATSRRSRIRSTPSRWQIRHSFHTPLTLVLQADRLWERRSALSASQSGAALVPDDDRPHGRSHRVINPAEHADLLLNEPEKIQSANSRRVP
jgi:hypothetical protein